MLIEFSVQNFRSIKDRKDFSMFPSARVRKDDRKHILTPILPTGKLELLQAVVIYGANASGKSNLLKALETLSEMIVNSSDYKLEDVIKDYQPYRLSSENTVQPVYFEIDFIAHDNMRYSYKISFDRTSIIEEALYFFPKKRKAKLFSRKKGIKISYGDYFRGDKKMTENQLLENQLFLSKAANNNHKQLKHVYLYFKNQIEFYILNHNKQDRKLIQRTAAFIAQNKNHQFTKNLNLLVTNADTGILGLTAKKALQDNWETYYFASRDAYEIQTIHKAISEDGIEEDILFSLEDESIGTKKLLAVGSLILNVLENGKLLIIDELDKSLHPQLTKILISLFHNPNTNPNNAQLIFATHDSSLLGSELFCKDQIWFTEKDFDGSTDLYSVSDISGVKKDHPLDKWYLSGRLGGVPAINESEIEFKFGEITDDETQKKR